MKYYVYSLSHKELLDEIRQPTYEVRVYGQYKPFTAIINDINTYRFSDFTVVATCDDDDVLRTRKKGR